MHFDYEQLVRKKIKKLINDFIVLCTINSHEWRMIPFLWNAASSHHSTTWTSSELAQTLVKRGTVFEEILPAHVTYSHNAPVSCKISYGPAFILYFFPNTIFYISFNRKGLTLTSWKAPKQLPTDPSKISHGVWAVISQPVWRKWNSA